MVEIDRTRTNRQAKDDAEENLMRLYSVDAAGYDAVSFAETCLKELEVDRAILSPEDYACFREEFEAYTEG